MDTIPSSTVFLRGKEPTPQSRKRSVLMALKRSFQWASLAKTAGALLQFIFRFIGHIRHIGTSSQLSELERRKLEIFNLLNFLSLVSGIVAPIIGLISNSRIPAFTWMAVFTPAFVNVLVLLLNHYRKYESGMITYFILYPVVTSFVYLNGLNPGMDLYFILCGILSVFFIPQIGHMLFSIGLSMISYFLLSVLFKNYHYNLEVANFGVYVFNQVLAIIFIFYGLFLIKKENSGYQEQLLSKNDILQQNNLEIQQQQSEIADKASQLEEQKQQLENLNQLKTKLFSIISHDLKGPMYALRTLFQEMQNNDLPAEEIKEMLPEVSTDLNNTTGLMENVLQWAKSQMQASTVSKQEFDISKVLADVLRPLRLSADQKKINLQIELTDGIIVVADKDMIALVIRNLVANAIKFTHPGGVIKVQAVTIGAMVEVAVCDDGVGMDAEQLKHLFNEFYTNNGTANESGTGLGLILCKEFVEKNDGAISVSSVKQKGSTFRFTVPLK